MKKNLTKIKNQNGYALLFTIMIISVISVITAGLLNASVKQLILSSLAKNSQIAFYQADTAADCALYFDLTKTDEVIENMISYNTPFQCGGYDLEVDGSISDYTLFPSDIVRDSNNPCFMIGVRELLGVTTISAKGYNICKLDNPNVVERAIEVKY